MKKILALSLAAMLALSIVGCSKNDDTTLGDADDGVEIVEDAVIAYEGHTFGYSVNEDGDYEITSVNYKGADMIDIKIPESIDGRPVSGIAADAFKADVFIKSVVIPSSVTYISDFAFYGCTGITEIVIPNSVTEIGQGAFRDCTALAKITFSNTLKTIDNYAFWNCSALEAIAIPATVETIGDGAFFNCVKISEVVVPASVKTVGIAAFFYCDALAKVTFEGNEVKFPVDADEAYEDVFDNHSESLVIVAAKDSSAAKYAEANNIQHQEPTAE